MFCRNFTVRFCHSFVRFGHLFLLVQPRLRIKIQTISEKKKKLIRVAYIYKFIDWTKIFTVFIKFHDIFIKYINHYQVSSQVKCYFQYRTRRHCKVFGPIHFSKSDQMGKHQKFCGRDFWLACELFSINLYSPSLFQASKMS